MNAIDDIDALIEARDISRLEQIVANCHLTNRSRSKAFDLDHYDPSAFAETAQVLHKIFAMPGRSLAEKTKSSKPLVYVISYPRSGNTMLTRMLAEIFDGQIFEALPGSFIPFSKSIYPIDYPFIRIVKDHVARPEYHDDRCIFLMRDGRDCVISLAYFTYKMGSHPYWRRDELPAVIKWLHEKFPFGGWAAHAAQVCNLKNGGSDKLLIQYSDLLNDAKIFERAVQFAANDIALTVDPALIFSQRGKYIESIGRSKIANQAWGIGNHVAFDSMFYDWSRNRGGTNWRTTWTPEAKRAFHDTGATDYLIEFGYETDPQWWR